MKRLFFISVLALSCAILAGVTDAYAQRSSSSSRKQRDERRAENVNASISGVGEIRCYASSSLRASVSGLSTITVGGNPDKVDIRGNKKSVRFR